MIGQAQKFVPILIGIMTWAFCTYLILKGLKQLFNVGFFTAAGVSLILAIIGYLYTKKSIENNLENLSNDRASVNKLFTPALIFLVQHYYHLLMVQTTVSNAV